MKTKRAVSFSAAAGLAALLAARPADAQLDLATIRGVVVDDQGQPLPAVKVELEYKEESRLKILKKTTTDKKGAYIYAGLRPGKWQVTFTKDGYKPQGVETTLSGGGISEIQPVTLAAGAPAPALGGASPAPGATDAAQAGRAKEAGQSYQKAVEAMRAGRDAEAEALFMAILAEFPGLAEVHHNVGYLRARRKDFPAAEASYRKAIELQPQSAESYMALSVLLADQKRGEEALKLLQDEAERFSQDAKFQFALGAAAFNLGQSPAAEAAFGRAAALDPAQVEVQFYLGSLALGRNDVPGAVQHLEKYVGAAPAGAPNLPTAQALLATLKKRK